MDSLLQGFAKGAYPHACGGTFEAYCAAHAAKGLSPRVWGNPLTDSVRLVIEGPIPTRVGEPRYRTAQCAGSWAYPHACGGTSAACIDTSSNVGLSPRVWGNRTGDRVVCGRDGPIPTRVGEPAVEGLRAGRARAYPHACGGTCNRVGAPGQ